MGGSRKGGEGQVPSAPPPPPPCPGAPEGDFRAERRGGPLGVEEWGGDRPAWAGLHQSHRRCYHGNAAKLEGAGPIPLG